MDWRDRTPTMLRRLTGPRGEPCTTQIDRRWLWHLEDTLGVSAPRDGVLGQVRADLRAYLVETCAHHWLHYQNDGTFVEHYQCLWCNRVA